MLWNHCFEDIFNKYNKLIMSLTWVVSSKPILVRIELNFVLLQVTQDETKDYVFPICNTKVSLKLAYNSLMSLNFFLILLLCWLLTNPLGAHVHVFIRNYWVKITYKTGVISAQHVWRIQVGMLCGPGVFRCFSSWRSFWIPLTCKWKWDYL